MTDLLGPGAFGAARTVTSRPVFPPGNGAGDPDTWVKDCSSPSLRDGSENRAAAHNVLLAQLRNSIRATGVSPDNTDDFMLLRAIRSQRMNWAGIFGGTANALTVTWSAANPAPVNAAERTGKPLRGLVQLANTGAVTLDGFPLKRRAGADLLSGDLAVGMLIEAFFDGTNYRLLGVVPSDIVAGVNASGTAPQLNYFEMVTAGTQSTPASVNTVINDFTLSGSKASDAAFGAGGTVTIGAKTAGIWAFSMLYNPSQVGGAPTTVQAYIYRNGAAYLNASINGTFCSQSGVIRVAAGDTLAMAVWQNAGGARLNKNNAVTPYTFFNLYHISS